MRLILANLWVYRTRLVRHAVPSAIFIVLCAASLPTRADIFHLSTGGRIDGELIYKDDQHYKIRTTHGTVLLTLDSVVRTESAPSPFEQYRKRKAQAPDTPSGQVELAEWCEENGFNRERRDHLKRALELDPNYEPARQALGYVRVDGLWVEGRTIIERGRSVAEQKRQTKAAADPEKLAAAIQVNWHRRITAIKATQLDSSLASLAEKGRRQILEIRDPLAIVPLVRILSDGSLACRELLVETLTHFPEDVATANLSALALVDPNRELRHRAINELGRRNDPRVIAQFRQALVSDNDMLIRRAAEGLGTLRARDALHELINTLKARRMKRPVLSLRRYFNGFGLTFEIAYLQVGSTMVRIDPTVALPCISPMIEPVGPLVEVTVFRTEVLEALRQISGEDFGFDQAAWIRWYEEQNS